MRQNKRPGSLQDVDQPETPQADGGINAAYIRQRSAIWKRNAQWVKETMLLLRLIFLLLLLQPSWHLTTNTATTDTTTNKNTENIKNLMTGGPELFKHDSRDKGLCSQLGEVNWSIAAHLIGDCLIGEK